MNNLDSVFNERLVNHDMIPSPAAWEKISAGLSKKNNPVLWLRWAAILLPGILLMGLYWMSQPTHSPAITQKLPPATPASSHSPVAASATLPTLSVATMPTGKTRRPSKAKPQTLQTPARENADPVFVTAVSTEFVHTISEPTIEPMTETPVNEGEKVKPIVLVYTLPPLETVDASHQGRKKPSSIQRVVEFAMAVKHSDPLADLRVMKDELLALDLKKKPSKKNQ